MVRIESEGIFEMVYSCILESIPLLSTPWGSKSLKYRWNPSIGSTAIDRDLEREV